MELYIDLHIHIFTSTMDGLDAAPTLHVSSSFEVKQIKTKPLQNQELSGDLVFSSENAWMFLVDVCEGYPVDCLSKKVMLNATVILPANECHKNKSGRANAGVQRPHGRISRRGELYHEPTLVDRVLEFVKGLYAKKLQTHNLVDRVFELVYLLLRQNLRGLQVLGNPN